MRVMVPIFFPAPDFPVSPVFRHELLGRIFEQTFFFRDDSPFSRQTTTSRPFTRSSLFPSPTFETAILSGHRYVRRTRKVTSFLRPGLSRARFPTVVNDSVTRAVVQVLSFPCLLGKLHAPRSAWNLLFCFPTVSFRLPSPASTTGWRCDVKDSHGGSCRYPFFVPPQAGRVKRLPPFRTARPSWSGRRFLVLALSLKERFPPSLSWLMSLFLSSIYFLRGTSFRTLAPASHLRKDPGCFFAGRIRLGGIYVCFSFTLILSLDVRQSLLGVLFV